MQPTDTADQAREKAQAAVHAAAAAIFPAGYKLAESPLQSRPCTDDSNQPTGQVSVSADFWVDGPDRSQNNKYYDNLKKWWSENGWSLETDSRPRDLFANAQRDGYLMSLEGTATGPNKGRLNIGASSPCVWPNGTPEPAS
ncbi:hypothetical protein [Amycolatopsis circi]|uniref:hypothetical protein n=1 Tax=Amycolatopsis circi TaxID=871959 RepID=UPI000E237FE3|nr:hypothetical protein [Amycolatopsis circi]